MSGMPGMNPSASADVQRTGNGASMMAERVVPESGPVAGGIEVTVYGRGFSDSTAVVFGTQLATGVRVLGTQVLTCVLPPSSTAGHARIICYNSNTGLDLRDLNQGLSGRVFNYVEDTDRSLIELVLQIVGLSQTSSKSSAATDAAQLLHSVVDQAEGSQGASEKADTTRKILALAQFQGFPQAVSERNLAQVEAYLVQLFAILLTQNLLLKQDIASTHASTRRNIMHNCALL
ncbi:SPT3 Dosage dependent suppressor of Ty-induced promoter mutations-like protein, partial [Spiromyces aspiralis]